VRVLLDAHVSSRHVGQRLAKVGHDVLALDQDETLSRLVDEEVLALATEQERIVITHNVRDFVPIVRRWAEAGRSHNGVILVTLASTEYGAILRRLEQLFAERPDQTDWVDRVAFMARG
jgi:predicted nuclease of predicted toxin-antitoxin system